MARRWFTSEGPGDFPTARATLVAVMVVSAMAVGGLACAAFSADSEPVPPPVEAGVVPVPLPEPVVDASVALDAGVGPEPPFRVEDAGDGLIVFPLDGNGDCGKLVRLANTSASQLGRASFGAGCRVCATAETSRFGISLELGTFANAKYEVRVFTRAGQDGPDPPTFVVALAGLADALPVLSTSPLGDTWKPMSAQRTVTSPLKLWLRVQGSAPATAPGSGPTCFDIDHVTVGAIPP